MSARLVYWRPTSERTPERRSFGWRMGNFCITRNQKSKVLLLFNGNKEADLGATKEFFRGPLPITKVPVEFEPTKGVAGLICPSTGNVFSKSPCWCWFFAWPEKAARSVVKLLSDD